MAHSSSELLLIDTSFFRSIHFVVDRNNNLTISTHSPYKTSIDVTPLDMIDPEPKIEKSMGEQWVIYYTILIVAFLSTFTVTLNQVLTQLPPHTFVLSIFCFLITVIPFAISYFKRNNIATYYFVGTKTKLFSINLPTNKMDIAQINDKINFVNSLSKKIKEINQHKSHATTPSVYEMNIVELFNYGIIDEFLFKSVKKRINDTLNVNSYDEVSKSNVVPFTSKKIPKKSPDENYSR